jgi:hypothetical protein
MLVLALQFSKGARHDADRAHRTRGGARAGKPQPGCSRQPLGHFPGECDRAQTGAAGDSLKTEQ